MEVTILLVQVLDILQGFAIFMADFHLLCPSYEAVGHIAEAACLNGFAAFVSQAISFNARGLLGVFGTYSTIIMLGYFVRDKEKDLQNKDDFFRGVSRYSLR